MTNLQVLILYLKILVFKKSEIAFNNNVVMSENISETIL